MHIIYRHCGQQFTLTFELGKWSGGHPGLASELNKSISRVLGVEAMGYYPTMWHKAKAVADFLKGTIDQPEPKFDTGERPGIVY